MSLLSVRNLKTYFRTGQGLARAVDGVYFDIEPGQTFALVGESGCGKSVTALSIMQLVPEPAGYIAGGEILYKDKDITKLSEQEKRRIRGNEISMIFQEPMTSLNPVLTVGDQIMETIVLHQKLSKSDAKQKAIEMLQLVGIPEAKQRFDEYPHQFSGGMKQRVMIAIALSCQPGLLIADEPTTALDVTIQAQVLELMQKLQEETGTAVLLITHDLGVVAEMAQRIAVMYAGQIAEVADTRDLFDSPHHPYTRKLLESLPTRQKRGMALQTIKGRVPKSTNYLPGCRFADRCHEVMEHCAQVLPETTEIKPGHRVSCHLYSDVRQKIDKVKEDLTPSSQQVDIKQKEAIIKASDFKVYFDIKKGLFKKTVGYVRAVDGVDMKIRKGGTLALVGESGCGKTTLGKGLLQLIPPTDGSVIYDNINLMELKKNELFPYRRRLQIIFQDPYSSLNPRMMVGEIVQEGMLTHKIGESKTERLERAGEFMNRVGLDPDVLNRYPHEFSGGQRQRISIARCLAVEPEFLVCDEATSALDVSVQAQILNLMKDLQREFDLTYLFITHDLSIVEYFADEVMVMYLGRIVERGTTEEIFDDTKHPYTQALLSAIPRIDPETGAKKIRLEGDVPSPVNPPSGCHFHPRCPHVMPECKVEYPPKTQFSDTHSCKCYLYE
ncbi:dipeptide ABC transporter ATP-binding protein [Candidatus Poribacteria bacterium]|nr:dipeptide ABC transporter ATP-binding protein [Candidatus Poribacteria bacterium]